MMPDVKEVLITSREIEQKVREIGEGTTEVQLMIIARELGFPEARR